MTRRHRRRWLLLVAVGLGSLALRGQDRAVGPRADRPLLDADLRRPDGTPARLREFAGPAGIVLAFTGNQCPNSNKSLPRLVELAQRYGPRGVTFLGVNSNASETGAAVAAHAREFRIPFPVCKDRDNAVADLAGVERTCEVLLLDDRGVVRYRGAIDDRFGRGAVKAGPAANYLADALDSLLAGRPIEVASTRAIGCPIERKAPAPLARVRPAPSAIVRAFEAREQREGPITIGPIDYARDVAPIVQAKCQSCHRPGQEAPFPLLGYEDVRRRAAGIEEVVRERRMPPWHADPSYGHFANDRSLSARDRATLLAWVEQGAPPGDPARSPPPREFPAGWSIGTPDVVFAIPRPNEVPAIGVLDYVIVTVPTDFRQDMWIQAAEICPEVRSIVHHIIVQVLPSDGTGLDRGEHLATYVPGDAPTSYEPGTAKLIPARSRLKFGIHYVPDGIARTDRSKIGLVFARGPVRHRAFTRSVENTRFAIPPHAADHKVASSFVPESDIQIYSFSPHMHLRGKDFRYTAAYPDGRVEVLLSVPAYDFGWQSSYILAEPRTIPRGTRIDCVAHFDNSAANPANPDPSARVEWGEQSFQEMMIGYFDYVLAAPADRHP